VALMVVALTGMNSPDKEEDNVVPVLNYLIITP
jgi:hypothetical protein